MTDVTVIRTIAVLLVFIMNIGLQPVKSCPKTCECSIMLNQQWLVNCSSRKQSTFPTHLPNNTGKVIIENNPKVKWPTFVINDTSWTGVTSFSFKNNFPIVNLTIRQLVPLSKLKKLSFSQSGLVSLESNIFGSLPFLETLDLSFNPDLEYDAIFNSVSPLNTKLKILNISYCNKIRGQQKFFRQRHFQKLRHSPLQVLDMTAVNLFNIEAGISVFLPKLEVLNVSHNHMAIDFRTLCQIALLKSLYVFDISFWKMPDPFFRVERSIYYGYDSEFQTEIEQTVEACNLDFGSASTCFPLAQSLRHFHFHHIKWSSAESPSISKCVSTNNMTKVWLNNNNYRLFNGTIKGVQRLKYLDFSENNIEYFSPEFMFHEPVLQVLNVSTNRLYKMENHSSFSGLVETNEFLQYIDLSNNQLQNVPYDIFSNNTQIVSINLSKNKLQQLNLNLTSPYLRLLDLSNNNLKLLNGDMLQQFDDLCNISIQFPVSKHLNISDEVPAFNSSAFAIDLTNNTFECACAYVDFLIWMKTTKVYLHNLNEYRCDLDGDLLPISDVSIETLMATCDVVLSAVVIATIVILCLCAIFSIIIVIMYRNSKRFSMQRKILKYKNSEPAKYVAFICYSHHDSDFVLRHLRPDLERRLAKDLSRSDGLLCINDRDFCIGEPIEEAIVRSVLASSMVILVLSEKFMDSQWCKFEMNIAWIEKKPILMILREKLVIKKLPYLLKNIYNKNVRLLWTGENRKDEFLQTLYNSMLNKL